ncbi:MAG TPA: SGNH/GDSL hydrolase family protein [Vicinamibacteria bacterium]|nr:SGNH/GDSL hydrolase family protein [Vicinamibacteria bacterium]
MGLFHLSELSAALGRGGRPYLEFLRVPTLSVGRWSLLPAAGLAFAAACGGSAPSGPAPVPMPTAVPGHTVVGIVFYDENEDGQAQPDEPIRIPDVEVSVGGRSGRTEKATGRVVITGVPDGQHAVAVRTDTLPPFYTVGAPLNVQSPQAVGTAVEVPLRLSIGRNRANLYMAFGDSITRQAIAAQDAEYPRRLQDLLAAHFGGAEVTNQGRDGTDSYSGMARITGNLQAQRPAYTLLLYGTNDWNDPACQDDPPCRTVENLRSMLQAVKREGSLPVVGTIPPVNPALTPAGRNDWIRAVNEALRPMAREEGALLVDVHAAFMRQAALPPLFADHVHPSDEGRQLLAETFFEAIAHGRSGVD